MADAITATYEFTLPEVGASANTWGAKLNANWTLSDQVMTSLAAMATAPGAGLQGSGDAVGGYQLAVEFATVAELRNGGASKAIAPAEVYEASGPVASSGSGTFTPDFNAARNFKRTLTGATTVANPSNQKAGQSGLLILEQDATGGYSVSFGSNWLFPGGQAPIGSGVNAISVVSYFVAEVGQIIAVQARNFAQ